MTEYEFVILNVRKHSINASPKYISGFVQQKHLPFYKNLNFSPNFFGLQWDGKPHAINKKFLLKFVKIQMNTKVNELAKLNIKTSVFIERSKVTTFNVLNAETLIAASTVCFLFSMTETNINAAYIPFNLTINYSWSSRSKTFIVDCS